jgi:hypothetical protein
VPIEAEGQSPQRMKQAVLDIDIYTPNAQLCMHFCGLILPMQIVMMHCAGIRVATSNGKYQAVKERSKSG